MAHPDGQEDTRNGSDVMKIPSGSSNPDKLERVRSPSPEGVRPPLPPRPNTLNLLSDESASFAALQSEATTAISRAEINTQTQEGANSAYSTLAARREQLAMPVTRQVFEALFSRRRELAAFAEFPGDYENDAQFLTEFDPVGEVDEDAGNEELVLGHWKQKQKHYLILSAAGKPIWTRHGDGGLISTYVGVIQTIISFYEDSEDHLRGFSAGDMRFVVVTRGPLHLVAISRMMESDNQLRLQLEALYMQILSTLTLPSLSHLFSVRPSTDLKRPLQGSETLLSSLADSFTRGSPSTLLTKDGNLLYGLVVAGGRLVSVVRPKKHSLHPGDLQLLFNMIFEADGVKAGGGESWIPVCLPGFNSNGYLYMYVSFLDLRDDVNESEDISKDESVAIVLISPNKESFFEMKEMRDAFVEQMEKNGSLKVIKTAIEQGRPSTTDIVPGTVIHHFLYKSRANVQFTMSSFAPTFTSASRRRRLMSIYNNLHQGIHAKHTNVKVHYCVSRSASSFAWVTPIFEFYCVAEPNANRNALVQGASKITQWIHQEEERLFIVGGAVF
ncbi:hypothetical protein N7470_004361 [Penicillium chermesinum]|nr:hypothetical protein N7470_004361 [Penicillium chermesinum]